MDDIFGKGVNYDYLVAIRLNSDGLLEKFNYPINNYAKLKQDLLDMLDGDIFDVIDMERKIRANLNTNYSYDLCFGYAYSDHDINLVEIDSIDIRKKQSEIKEKEKIIKAAKKKFVERMFPFLSKKEKQQKAESLSEQAIEDYHYHQKLNFLKKRAPYIECSAYYDARAEIKNKVIFLSSERHGWNYTKGKKSASWKYTINDDLNIELWSNFCYGNSSRFILTVYYKGYKICPYSEFVTYRFANKTDIIQCTRKFIESRSSWESAAHFVVNFCNSAIENPEEFVKKEILFEINTLVKELTKIATSKERYLEAAFKKRPLDSDRFSNVKGVKDYDELELKDYNNNPKEYELLFRMEKITGALSFLDSMDNFVSISRAVKHAIDKIKGLNAKIYPELREVVEPLAEDVAVLYEELFELRAKENKLIAKLAKHYDRIDCIRNKYESIEEQDRHEESYRKRHPDLKITENEHKDLTEKIKDKEYIYRGRNNFLKKLNQCKTDIEEAGILD